MNLIIEINILQKVVQASVHSNKLKFFISRVFLTNKSYRIIRYPILGKHWYLYPICLIKHWIYLITPLNYDRLKRGNPRLSTILKISDIYSIEASDLLFVDLEEKYKNKKPKMVQYWDAN